MQWQTRAIPLLEVLKASQILVTRSHFAASDILLSATSQQMDASKPEKASREGQATQSLQENKQPPAQPPAPSYPTGFAFGLILFALFISLFCVALDSTIIATAIPRITDQFHSLQDVGWYGSSYLLTKCGQYSLLDC